MIPTLLVILVYLVGPIAILTWAIKRYRHGVKPALGEIVVVVLAVFLGFEPFTPEPHLWQKLNMLWAGELVKPIDIFDLFLHGSPVVLLVIRWVRMGR